MTLEDLGYTPLLEQYRQAQGLAGLAVGRVAAEHKERYLVRTAEQEYEAEVIGQLRFSAQSRADFPAVGDWVALLPYDEDKALIHAVLPRKNALERQAVGRQGEKQLIATNIDAAFIVQAVDRDFNLNRLERYLTLCYAAGIQPFIVLSKVDLVDEATLAALLEQVTSRTKTVPVLPLSNTSQAGLQAIRALIRPGQTWCLLGSSGVGKSSLLNNLAGSEQMATGAIGSSTQRGRHVTSHRELIVLPGGGLLIDNPGLREVGLTDAGGGLETTFDEIMGLAQACKFKDCTHTNEIGCAVLAALEDGTLDEDAYENFLRMQREQEHFSRTVAEKRQRDREFGKMVKQVKRLKDHKRKGH
jgi:ribosome biogenesis GTPase